MALIYKQLGQSECYPDLHIESLSTVVEFDDFFSIALLSHKKADLKPVNKAFTWNNVNVEVFFNRMWEFKNSYPCVRFYECEAQNAAVFAMQNPYEFKAPEYKHSGVWGNVVFPFATLNYYSYWVARKYVINSETVVDNTSFGVTEGYLIGHNFGGYDTYAFETNHGFISSNKKYVLTPILWKTNNAIYSPYLYFTIEKGDNKTSVSYEKKKSKFNRTGGLFIPVLLHYDESTNTYYFLCDSNSVPYGSVYKLDVNTNKFTDLVNYTSVSKQTAVTSIPSKPVKQEDGTYKWYKFVYEAQTDEEGNVTGYIPTIYVGTWNPVIPDQVNYQKASVDTIPETLDVAAHAHYKSSSLLYSAVVNCEEVNGHLVIMVYDLFWFGNYKRDVQIDENALAIHLFKINSNGSLTYVNSKNVPSDTIFIQADPTLNDWDKGFIIWRLHGFEYCKFTFDSNVYEVKNSFGFGNENLYVKLFGVDEFNRLWVAACREHSYIHSIKRWYLMGDTIPENVEVKLEKDYYDTVPVDTYVEVKVKNFRGELIPAKVSLAVLTDNAIFSDNNQPFITVDVEDGSAQVPLKITKEGIVKIKVVSFREL